MQKTHSSVEVYSISGPDRKAAAVLLTPNGEYVVKFYVLGAYQTGMDKWTLNKREAYIIADTYAGRQ